MIVKDTQNTNLLNGISLLNEQSYVSLTVNVCMVMSPVIDLTASLRSCGPCGYFLNRPHIYIAYIYSLLFNRHSFLFNRKQILNVCYAKRLVSKKIFENEMLLKQMLNY